MRKRVNNHTNKSTKKREKETNKRKEKLHIYSRNIYTSEENQTRIFSVCTKFIQRYSKEKYLNYLQIKYNERERKKERQIMLS